MRQPPARQARWATIVNDSRAVFNITGKKYRIMAWINYPNQVVYIGFVGTHRKYDQSRKRPHNRAVAWASASVQKSL
jgi:mRNA-degrading endonuclease HigB of HigAB toxin-antitoxin module